MKVEIVIIVVLSVISVVLADLRYRGNAVHPDYPGQCYYEELKQAIPKKQSYRPINRDGRCESIYCRQDYVLELEYCSRHNMMANETCKIDSDLRRPFPECCPKLVCQPTDNFI